MLPIAAEIAARSTREHAHSALPGSPVQPLPVAAVRTAVPRRRRSLAAALRRVAAASGRLADRVEHPVPAE
jgi:hypothetical protein